MTETVQTGLSSRKLIGESLKLMLGDRDDIEPMVGIEDDSENQTWSGIFNHVLKTARLATYLAQKLKERGENVDPNLIKAVILASHSGRRTWDELKSNQQKPKNDTELALAAARDANFPDNFIDILEAHAVGDTYDYSDMDTWEKKLTMYADFRTTQDIVSLDDRFRDIEARGVPSGRVTQEWVENTRSWAHGVEEEIFEIIDDIKPEDITDGNLPTPLWEAYLRRLYIQDAEQGIMNRIDEAQRKLEACTNNAERERVRADLLAQIKPNTWWGDYVARMLNNNPTISVNSKDSPSIGKQQGIRRAIAYFTGYNLANDAI